MNGMFSIRGVVWMVVAAAASLLVFALAGGTPATAASGTLSVSPASQTVPAGNTVTVNVVQNSSVTTVGAGADLTFNPAILQLIDVVAGPPYSGASFFIGVAPQTKAQAIAEANTTGSVLNSAVFFAPGGSTVGSGNQTALVYTFKGCTNGTSNIQLSDANAGTNPDGEIIEQSGDSASPLTLNNGTVTISGSGTDSDGDGKADGCDTCPNWPNPSQALPNWTVPANDPDCDGFTTAAETSMGTSPTTQCGTGGANPYSNNWPGDLVKNNAISISDVLALKPVFNQTVPPASARFDLVVNGSITISDVLSLKPIFNKTCSTSGP